MDKFCLIYKSSGDYALYLIGLWLAICAISPKFKNWFRELEGKLNKNRYLNVFFGISLAVFCVGLICVSVRIQLVQGDEGTLRYQTQMELKEHAEKLEGQLFAFADQFDKADWQTKDNLSAEFSGRYEPRIGSILEKLDDEGIYTNNITSLIYGSPSTRNGSNIWTIATELRFLSDQLPTRE